MVSIANSPPPLQKIHFNSLHVRQVQISLKGIWLFAHKQYVLSQFSMNSLLVWQLACILIHYTDCCLLLLLSHSSGPAQNIHLESVRSTQIWCWGCSLLQVNTAAHERNHNIWCMPQGGVLIPWFQGRILLVFEALCELPLWAMGKLSWGNTCGNTWGNRRHQKWGPQSGGGSSSVYKCRLTLQLDGGDVCSQKEVCVSIEDISAFPPSVGSDVGSGDNMLGSGSEYSLFDKIVELEEVDTGEFDDIFDEDLYQENEIKDMIAEESGGHSVAKVIVPAEKGCFVAKSFFTEYGLPWIPDCDCEGYYKRVQCLQGGNECWCSTLGGSEIQNSRRTLNCTDPQSM